MEISWQFSLTWINCKSDSAAVLFYAKTKINGGNFEGWQNIFAAGIFLVFRINIAYLVKFNNFVQQLKVVSIYSFIFLTITNLANSNLFW